MGCAFSCCVKTETKEAVQNKPTKMSSISAPSPVNISDKSPVGVETVQCDIPTVSVTGHVVNGDMMGMGDSSSIMNLYNKYVNPQMGQISAEGVEQLCNDLQLDPEDFRVLVLAYCLGAQVMCRFTEDEFVTGCQKHGITSFASMKQSIPKLLKTVEGAGFPDFYHWTYKFALDVESGQRTLPTDMAISLWKLVFYQNSPPILDRWLTYLQSKSALKGISRDTWDMFLIFVDQIGDNLEAYDDSEAWPSLLDDFVEQQLVSEAS